MPYDIFGFVETAPRSPGPWVAAFDVGDIAGFPDTFSRTRFGLAKVPCSDAPAANRGLPADASREVCDAVEGDSDSHGHTHITWDEIKNVDVSDSPAWQKVFVKIAELQQASGLPDAGIRVVLWANW